MTTRLVIDPPIQDGRVLYQEECCYNRNEKWQVPARALHIATEVGAVYIPPLANWDEFAAAVRQYDETWMLYTLPLSSYLQVPDDVRGMITAVVNPRECVAEKELEGFRSLVSTMDFGLDVAEQFWFLYDGNEATIQVNSGCPYHCQYCVWNCDVFPARRWADPVLVANLANRADKSYLICSQITGDHEWIDAFIAARAVPFNTFASDLNCAHSPIYDDDVKRLAEVGLSRAVVGVEALSERSLDRLGCPHNVIQARSMFALLAELNVYGSYQLRRGYGETIEEISETTQALVAIASDLGAQQAPHVIRVGAIYFWHASDLSRSLKLKTVAPLGFPVQVEDMEPARIDAWHVAYNKLRDAGWNVR